MRSVFGPVNKLIVGSFVASKMYFRTDASAIKTKFSSAGLSSGQESGNDTEGVFDCVGAGAGVGVGVGIGVEVGVDVGVEVGVDVGVEVGVDVGLFTATPLFHTNFFPDLMQA